MQKDRHRSFTSYCSFNSGFVPSLAVLHQTRASINNSCFTWFNLFLEMFYLMHITARFYKNTKRWHSTTQPQRVYWLSANTPSQNDILTPGEGFMCIYVPTPSFLIIYTHTVIVVNLTARRLIWHMWRTQLPAPCCIRPVTQLFDSTHLSQTLYRHILFCEYTFWRWNKTK